MSNTEELAAVVTAANELTQTVTDKIGAIDTKVNQFEAEARNIASQATDTINMAKIGFNKTPSILVTPGPNDDTGALVAEAYRDGYKHVSVDWSADGQDRHWNSMVAMPVGTTLFIHGPISDVATLGGSVKSDRACYAKGTKGGTSVLGSPMIFRNLHPSTVEYPHNVYSKVVDETSLIQASGNNTIHFGNGTYVHDMGGMVPYYYGNALIRISSYVYDLPNYIGGGGHHATFYLSGPFVNNCLGTAVCEIRMMMASWIKLSSDGPALNVDKGYKRLLDRGEPGATSDLLTIQPWEITEAQAAVNDVSTPGMNWSWYVGNRGVDTEADRPRIVSTVTFSHTTGWTQAQFGGGVGEMSLAGLQQTAGQKLYTGAYE